MAKCDGTGEVASAVPEPPPTTTEQAEHDQLPSLAARPDHDLGHPFVVRRQDDHGNKYMVSRHHTREDAQSRADDLEASGHKQTYWVAHEG